MRRKLRRGSVLGDLMAGARFGGSAPNWQPAPPTPVGVSTVGSGNLDQQLTTDLARTVIEIPFDDSIDSTHPLECFFQMPQGVVRVRSAKVWVQMKSFRAYETGSSSGGSTVSSSSGGSSSPTSSSSGSHSHSLSYSLLTTDAAGTGATGTGGSTSTTDAQGVHNHSDPQGGVTGDAGSHSHNVGAQNHSHTGPSHGHGYFAGLSTTASTADHSHTVTIAAHTHTVDTSHTHTMTYGIFEQAATGTVALYLADDGTTYGSAIVGGVPQIVGQELAPGLTNIPGDKRIRINGTGLARIQVLLVLDLILQLGV